MIEIIPAIDLSRGKCVRLLHGDFSKETVYSDTPEEVAYRFAAAGLKRLHIVDLDGARSGSLQQLGVLRRISSMVRSTIDYGGGIRTREDVHAAFEAGAAIATIGSLAVRSPKAVAQWAQEFGPDRFLIGIDVRDGVVAVNAWLETSGTTLEKAIEQLFEQGFRRFFVTDISKDGAMQGPSIDLYTELLERFHGIALIASGGVREMADVEALDAVGCEGVIVGRAIYERTITLEEAALYAR